MLALAVALLGSGTTARADVISVFNTGVNSSGTPLTDGTIGDPHYTLASVPSGTTTIRVRTSAGGFPIGPWIGNNSKSAWIGPNNDTSVDGPPGHYDYRTTFTLPANANVKTASLTGQWAADNDLVDILLNGVSTKQANLPFTDAGGGTRPLNTFTPFSINSGFVSGLNTLDFIVNNQGGGSNPTGVRVEVSGSVLPVPEPSTSALMALAGAALVGWRRYRGRKQAAP
jgi:hypothetical protein